MNPTTQIIGSALTSENGQLVRRNVVIQRNDSGTVTVSGPCGMRDYASAGFAKRFAQRALSHPSNKAEWV